MGEPKSIRLNPDDWLKKSQSAHLYPLPSTTEYETIPINGLCDIDEAIAIYAISFATNITSMIAGESIVMSLNPAFERGGQEAFSGIASKNGNHIVAGYRVEVMSGTNELNPIQSEDFILFPKPIPVANNIRAIASRYGGTSESKADCQIMFYYQNFKATPMERRMIRGMYG